MKAQMILLLCAVAVAVHSGSDQKADALMAKDRPTKIEQMRSAISKCSMGSKGFNCRRKIRCKRRHHICFSNCRKTKGRGTCKDICYKQVVHRACNNCHSKKCRHKRGVCFKEVKLCQATCTSATCRQACRCHPKKLAASEKRSKEAKKKAAKNKTAKPKAKTNKKNKKPRKPRSLKVCPAGSKGYSCRRKHRCNRRHHACMAHCKTKKHKGARCHDICYLHMKHRACNTCHSRKCRKARALCYFGLKMCKTKCSGSTCKAECRCKLGKNTKKKPKTKPKTKPLVVVMKTKKVSPKKAVIAKPEKVKKPVKKRCPRGYKGFKCRRNHRCKRRHHRCAKNCQKHDRACIDGCYTKMKSRACNACYDSKCRKDRTRCFVDLKVCQAKCSDNHCRGSCRCSDHPKPKPKPTANTTQPVLAKNHVVHPAKPICTCHRRVKKCSYHKKCDLREKKAVKQCVDKALTRIVYCQCEAHDPITGKCTKKKLQNVCVESDKEGKCLKYDARCVPVCNMEKCIKEAMVGDGKKQCVESICTKEDASETMQCTKYKEEPVYKCKEAGYSHICKWVCAENKCSHPSSTYESTHKVGYSPNTSARNGKVKVYTKKGKLMTEKELAKLHDVDPPEFSSIMMAMDAAAKEAKTESQKEAIQKEIDFLHGMKEYNLKKIHEKTFNHGA